MTSQSQSEHSINLVDQPTQKDIERNPTLSARGALLALPPELDRDSREEWEGYLSSYSEELREHALELLEGRERRALAKAAQLARQTCAAVAQCHLYYFVSVNTINFSGESHVPPTPQTRPPLTMNQAIESARDVRFERGTINDPLDSESLQMSYTSARLESLKKNSVIAANLPLCFSLAQQGFFLSSISSSSSSTPDQMRIKCSFCRHSYYFNAAVVARMAHEEWLEVLLRLHREHTFRAPTCPRILLLEGDLKTLTESEFRYQFDMASRVIRGEEGLDTNCSTPAISNPPLEPLTGVVKAMFTSYQESDLGAVSGSASDSGHASVYQNPYSSSLSSRPFPRRTLRLESADPNSEPAPVLCPDPEREEGFANSTLQTASADETKLTLCHVGFPLCFLTNSCSNSSRRRRRRSTSSSSRAVVCFSRSNLVQRGPCSEKTPFTFPSSDLHLDVDRDDMPVARESEPVLQGELDPGEQNVLEYDSKLLDQLYEPFTAWDSSWVFESEDPRNMEVSAKSTERPPPKTMIELLVSPMSYRYSEYRNVLDRRDSFECQKWFEKCHEQVGTYDSSTGTGSSNTRDRGAKTQTENITESISESLEDTGTEYFPNPEDLADSGFIYNGERDCVTCFSCGITLHQWKQKDLAWTEHIRYNPICSWALGCLGVPRVRELLLDLDRSGQLPTSAPPSIVPSAPSVVSSAASAVAHISTSSSVASVGDGAGAASVEQDPSSLAKELIFLQEIHGGLEAYIKSLTDYRVEGREIRARMDVAVVRYLRHHQAISDYLLLHAFDTCMKETGDDFPDYQTLLVTLWEYESQMATMKIDDPSRFVQMCGLKRMLYIDRLRSQHMIVAELGSSLQSRGMPTTTPPTVEEVQVKREGDISGSGRVEELSAPAPDRTGPGFASSPSTQSQPLPSGADLRRLPQTLSSSEPQSAVSSSAVYSTSGSRSHLPTPQEPRIIRAQGLRAAPSAESSAPLTDDRSSLCRVCFERPIEVVVIPCGHFVACEQCLSKVQQCPICRQPVRGLIRAFT